MQRKPKEPKTAPTYFLATPIQQEQTMTKTRTNGNGTKQIALRKDFYAAVATAARIAILIPVVRNAPTFACIVFAPLVTMDVM